MPVQECETLTSNARQFIPLARAYLCQDCDSVGNNAMHCPSCSSQVLMGLAGVLDRKGKKEVSNLCLFPTLATRRMA
jgi:primosomal protein N'